METTPYTEEFFNNFIQSSLRSAGVIAPYIMETFGPLDSVVDVGCGLGIWLSVFHAFGAEVTGIDGNNVPQSHMFIEPEQFKRIDLSNDFELPKRYSLCTCFEVAEHLSEKSADSLVARLCLLSDLVVFSAAIPGQGGTHHINEQWQSYWAEKFNKKNYKCFDIIRPVIWDNQHISVWYKQNTLVYCNMSNEKILATCSEKTEGKILDIVHPALMARYAKQADEKLRGIASEEGITMDSAVRLASLYLKKGNHQKARAYLETMQKIGNAKPFSGYNK